MPTLLYLRGEPGAGKITVGRLLAERLDWPLFWVHDLDPLWRITGGHTPELLDRVTAPIIGHVLAQGRDLIYVRPSRGRQTVEAVRAEAAKFPLYRVVMVYLTADYQVLCHRVESREPVRSRIDSRYLLNDYLSARPREEVPGEHIVNTTYLTPTETADLIQRVACPESGAR